MGASESTTRSNGTEEEEEPQHANNRRSSGSSTTAIATAAAAGVALAWGISRVLSDNTDTQERNHHMTESSLVNSPHMVYEANQQRNRHVTESSLDNSPRMVYESNQQRNRHVAESSLVNSPHVVFEAKEERNRHVTESSLVNSPHMLYEANQQRNRHGTDSSLVNSTHVVFQAKEERNRHVTESSLVNSPHMVYEAKQVWSRPPEGLYKMNTDGGCQGGQSGYGGILRDHNGAWVGGFIGIIDESDHFTAEINGILKGLELLNKFNLKGAILESDHKSACGFVNGQGEYRNKSEIVVAAWDIIKRCRYLRVKNRITVNHIPRSANQCADKLADIAIEEKLRYKYIKYLPPQLKVLVATDAEFNG